MTSCNLLWMDNVVNNFTSWPTNFGGSAEFMPCCTQEEVCPPWTNTSAAAGCGYGFIRCNVGNSKYVCKLSQGAEDCYQEGASAQTRTLPCCKDPHFQSPACVSARCQEPPVGSNQTLGMDCKWVDICLGVDLTQFTCVGGFNVGICGGMAEYLDKGYTYSVQEVDLNKPGSKSCLSMPSVGCNVLGALPPQEPSKDTLRVIP